MANQKYAGRAQSVPLGVAWGVGVSLGISGAAIGLLAKLVDSETLAWENIGYGIMLMLLTASFAGAIAAHAKIKRQRMMVCLMTGAAFFGILLSMTALFFGGQYHGVGVSLLLVLAGSGAAGLLGLREGRRGGKRRIPHR